MIRRPLRPHFGFDDRVRTLAEIDNRLHYEARDQTLWTRRTVDVWKLTLLEFMGGTTQGEADGMNPVDSLLQSLGAPAWIGSEDTLPGKTDFATATASPRATPADQVLLERTNDGWNPIGAYVGETIAIKDEHRGKGLSTDLILRCSKHRDPPAEARKVTESGYAALAKAYRVAVERAIAEGLDVPHNVQAEHRKRKSR